MGILHRPKTPSFPVRERERHKTRPLNCVLFVLKANFTDVPSGSAWNSAFKDNTRSYSVSQIDLNESTRLKCLEASNSYCGSLALYNSLALFISHVHFPYRLLLGI